MAAEHKEPNRSPQDILAVLPTAAISDALDRLGLPGSLHGIEPLRNSLRACGPAFTVTYAPVEDGTGTVGDFLDDVAPGSVIVIDNQGKTECTVWGGIMTQVAATRGIAATVINGVCRDTETSFKTAYPVWSAGRFMRTGKDRVKMVAIQRPVEIDSVTVYPDDLVCCDDDGVVIVPAVRAEEVSRIAEDIESVEDLIVRSVRDGSTLLEARSMNGYHSLQTPEHNAVS